jgi:hypothetical protein
MILRDAVPQDGVSLVDGLQAGSILGKRYTDEGGSLQVLVTKGGQGTLAVAGVALSVKAAAPLPSSD